MSIPDDLLRLTRRLHLEGRHRTAEPWKPAVDIYRTRSGWMLKFELAGIRPEDVKIRIRGRWLAIGGVRRDIEIAESREFHSLEIAYTAFRRAVELPAPIDRARIDVDYREGMLLVHLVTEESES